MALNFGILQPVNIGGQIMAGEQEAQRNQLAQQQLKTGEMQQEKAGLELRRFKRGQDGLDVFLRESTANGKTGSPEAQTDSFYKFALTQGDPTLIMAAQQLNQAAKERRAYQASRTPGALAAPAIAPTPELPGVTVGGPNPPTVLGAAPMPTANRLAPAPTPAASVNRLGVDTNALQTQIDELRNMYPNVPQAQKKADRLEKQLDESRKLFSVGGNLVTGGGDVRYKGPDKTNAPPVSIVEFERAKEDAAFMRFLQERAAAIRPPAQPRAEPAPRTQQITLSDGSLGIVNMDTGAITPSTLAGAPVKGKPSATAEKAALQRKQLNLDLDRAIIELTDAAKDNGLIDQSTGSGAGRLVDLAAGFGGQATKGAIAIGKLQPIADIGLKIVPRFEGPQSNADTTSYKQASAQAADPTLPRKIRKEAVKTVVRLMKERKNQFVSADMAAEGVAPAAPGTPSANVDQQRQDANNAIAKGAPAAAVRQRFKQNTGQEL